jgi:exodeoxyribonuclease V alpha subunit
VEQNTNKKILTLTGIIKKVLYTSNKNGYCIAVLETDQKICGNYFDADIEKLVGEDIIMTGDWTTHKKYGSQFEFITLKVQEAELYFFLTKIVKGVGKSVAKELLSKYGEDKLIDILNNNPKKLLKEKGIKEKKLITITNSWQKFKHMRDLGSYLSKYGVSSNFVTKIFEEFGAVENIVDKIKENPYILTNIKGIGFKKADEIAQTIGIDKKSQFRVSACLNFILNEYSNSNGNSSISKKKIFMLLDDALYLENENRLYENTINEMVRGGDIYKVAQERYALSMLYHAEKNIINFFKNRKKITKKIIIKNFTQWLEKKEKTIGFKLSQEQQKAVSLINDGNSTLMLIGYAGTGKSTSSRALLELLEEIYGFNEIHCIALSGIASQRIHDTTGYKSSTIQSLLLSSKEKDYFDYKVLLLDEASMVNSIMFYQIISKIKDDTIFIIVGDDGQLPAIGAGDILADAINFELAPVCKLTKIYRQNEQQAIATIANDIRCGQVPKYKGKYDDFQFHNISIDNYYSSKTVMDSNEFSNVRQNNTHRILNSILNITSNYLQESYQLIKDKKINKFLTLFQVITPMKSGILGVENINKYLQNLFNSSREKSVKTRLYEYKLADKVIHIKNTNMKAQTMDMYKEGSDKFLEKRIFNGQLGMIIKLNFEESKAIILYPNDNIVVFYDFDELESLISLAYCLTIHKTQGMEYETALIPMTFSHFIMHNTKLLYTAITRAKNMCYVVGEEEAFVTACKRIETTKRETVIQDLLEE